MLLRYASTSGAPFTLCTQLGQAKLFDTPSFHAGVEALRYADSSQEAEALSMRATAMMVALGSLQSEDTSICENRAWKEDARLLKHERPCLHHHCRHMRWDVMIWDKRWAVMCMVP